VSPGLSALWIAALAVQIGLSVVAAGFAVARRRQPTSTLAWLLAILFIPVAGALAYFALANPYIARPRRQWKATGRWRADLEREGTGAGELPGSEAARSLMRGVCRATGMRPTHFNHVALSTDNVASAATKEAAIAAATRSVWAEYYIVEGDDAGRRFLDLLTDRAAAGLDVRLLIDAVGSADIDDAAVARLLAAGGRMERFHPVNPFRRRWAVHLRNHRKILVIDGALGFVGSMNVGDNYAGRGRKRTGAWRDTLLRVEGPAVRDLARVFADDWAFMSGEDLSLPAPGPAGGDTAVAIVPYRSRRGLAGRQFRQVRVEVVQFAGQQGAKGKRARAERVQTLGVERCVVGVPEEVPKPEEVAQVADEGLRQERAPYAGHIARGSVEQFAVVGRALRDASFERDGAAFENCLDRRVAVMERDRGAGTGAGRLREVGEPREFGELEFGGGAVVGDLAPEPGDVQPQSAIPSAAIRAVSRGLASSTRTRSTLAPSMPIKSAIARNCSAGSIPSAARSTSL
jgi:hypothetical protein